MKKLRVAFLKADSGQMDDKFIDKFSGNLGYSHCEMVVNPGTMIGAHYNAKGVKKFHYNNVYHSDMWDIVEIDLDGKHAIKYMEDMLDTPYDALGVVLFFIGVRRGDKSDAVWCSEVCSYACNIVFKENNIDQILPGTIMPNDLFDLLVNEYGGDVVNTVDSRKKVKEKLELDRFGRIKKTVKDEDTNTSIFKVAFTDFWKRIRSK